MLFLQFFEEIGYLVLYPKELRDDMLDQSLQGFDISDFDKEALRVVFLCLSNLDMVLIYFLMAESHYFIFYPHW